MFILDIQTWVGHVPHVAFSFFILTLNKRLGNMSYLTGFAGPKHVTHTVMPYMYSAADK